MPTLPGPVLIAGAGIAGLTTAIAFALRGFAVRVFERAGQLEAIGAGIQISPNATRILAALGVLPHLRPSVVEPPAVLIKDAATLKLLARVPLGEIAEKRWGAPYLVVHRSDLQAALMRRVAEIPEVEFLAGHAVTAVRQGESAAVATVETGGTDAEVSGSLVVAADGVWSGLRRLCRTEAQSRFSGELAWRATVSAKAAAGAAFSALSSVDCVTTFLHGGFHLVAYPVNGGGAFNLVAFTGGKRIGEDWSGGADPGILRKAATGVAPALVRLIELAGPWTTWPVHTVDPRGNWVGPGPLALIGDAAHAMTPFAAQGAAMAIEDADTLAGAVARRPDDLAAALAGWEAARRIRVLKVARRGALNRLAWHAAGPVALARNLVLKARGPDRLAADLDWLYGWRGIK